MAYHLEGRLLEVCDCRVLCPCWIGEDPDNGTCDSVLAYHFDAGSIDGVDVTGRTIAIVSHIPGNVLNGNFRVALYLDEGTSDLQQEALLNVYGGKHRVAPSRPAPVNGRVGDPGAGASKPRLHEASMPRTFRHVSQH